MRQIRSTHVTCIQRNYHGIFAINDPRFRIKEGRKDLPEVKALLEHKNFLYDAEAADRLEGLFRHPCILRVCHLPLYDLLQD